jgi:polyisoprenoid-binding protein YceI
VAHDASDMRHLLLALALCSPVTLAACTSQLDDKPKAAVQDAKPADAKPTDAKPATPTGTTAALDTKSSRVGFVGAKVTADHAGTFTDFDGRLTLDGKTPALLELTVKVASLQIDPPDLQAHLLNADFFDAPTYPESTFVSKAIREKAGEGGTTHEIEGNLTLHGQTKLITFPATLELGDTLAKGTAEFTIDRTQFGIVYPGMTDDLIKDEVLLQLSLAFPLG